MPRTFPVADRNNCFLLMNPENSPITEDDFRAVVRILGDIAVMEGEPNDKRNHLMREPGVLLDSDT